MSCKDQYSSCSLDMGRGCKFCNCGDETSAKVCEGCYKLHTTDWLEGMPQMITSDIYEVRFKNTRRGYYSNVNGLELKKGDIVAVEASPGHDIGIISLTGDMVARQMKRVGFNPLNGEFKKIYRLAKPYDIEKWQEAIALEHETMIRSRQIAAEMGLNMKIGDVEYQGDKIKAIFYYIADERVDFRELIKVFADQFRIRVEMKQIGARQEAGRIGGIGACGRELCCASWISNFVSVTTNAARTQEISLNPQKLAGQCSKLKCCMTYELDTYIDARRGFPKVHEPLYTLDGEYYLVKTDILAGTMSFSTSPNGMVGMITLPSKRVKEIIELNRRGVKVDRLDDESTSKPVKADPGFVNVIGEESITRFDNAPGNSSGRPKRKKRSKPRNTQAENAEGKQKPDGQQSTEEVEKRKSVSDRRGKNTGRRQGSAPAVSNGDGEKNRTKGSASREAGKPKSDSHRRRTRPNNGNGSDSRKKTSGQDDNK